MKFLLVAILVLSLGQAVLGQICQKTRLKTREVVKFKKVPKLNKMMTFFKKKNVTEYKEVPYKTVR